jgi:hypothetical protein
MKHLEEVQERPAEQRASSQKGLTSRSYQCKGGRFGLIRHRVRFKQFCSRRCLRKDKANIELATMRLKEWTHFLTRKP